MRTARVVAAAVAWSVAVMAPASFFEVLPSADHDPAVRTLRDVVGHDWGEEVSSPAQISAYLAALAASAPERVAIEEYARSLEGRPLFLVVVSSPENLARLEAIRAGLARLGDPRGLDAAERERLLGSLPAVVWIACSVHGDEASGGEAGMALAYRLAAGRSPELATMLERTVVVIDPMQNPDGRARFVASTRQARGAEPDPEPASAEHVQPWPGGRYSHDLFDLNRDWFALTHPESSGRVAAMLAWHPAVVVDLHEMGADQGYFFAPPAGPHNPLVSAAQASLWELIGRANAAAFDRQGWRYWTREIFDAFYPGYGESWPFFSGAVGMTYEQATSRGPATRLDDDTVLRFADTVGHHLAAAYTTCRVVAENRRRFLESWAGYRATAVEAGRTGGTRAFVIEEGAVAERAAALAELLARQGIEVERLRGAGPGLAAGSYLVRLDQPMGRLASTLLARHFDLDESFRREQERRWSKRLPDQIYDVTAWSLPLLWDVEVRELKAVPSGVVGEPVRPGWRPEGVVERRAGVAYLLPWTGLAAARATAGLLREGVKLRVAAKPFTLAGTRYDVGTIVVRVAENDDRLAARIDAAARRHGVRFAAADSGYAEAGIDLGSTSVRLVRAPRVALLWDAPASPAAVGAARYAIERAAGYRVTVLRTRSLAGVDLSDFDVIVIADAWGGGEGYLREIGEGGGKRLAAWVEEGGVLVGIGAGAAFLCDEKVGLLASTLESLDVGSAKDGESAASGKAQAPPPTYEERVRPEKESPPPVPGAIVGVELDTEHLLAAGFTDGNIGVLVNSRRLFAPLPLDRGTNVGLYAPAERLQLAGFMLDASRQQLPKRAYMMDQPRGRGRVVAFAEDVAFRGYAHASMLLLVNAVLFGPTL